MSFLAECTNYLLMGSFHEDSCDDGGSSYWLILIAGQRHGGWCTQLVHGHNRMTIDPGIPTMPGRSTSGFHQLEVDIACTKREAQ